MNKILSRLKNKKENENYLIELRIGIKYPGEEYNSYQCISFNEVVRINDKENIIIIPFLTLNPIRGRKFEVKFIFNESIVLFSADCYDNPSEKYKLEIKKEDENEIIFHGDDGLDDIDVYIDFFVIFA